MVETTLLSLACGLAMHVVRQHLHYNRRRLLVGGVATRMCGYAAGDDVMDDAKPVPKPSPLKKGPHLCMFISSSHNSTIALRASQVSHFCAVHNDTE